jgi:hypothetical protein
MYHAFGTILGWGARLTYFVAVVRRGPVVAGREVEAPGPRTAAAEALVVDARRRREGGQPPGAGDVVGDVAGSLVDAGRWSARPWPGCLLEAWAFRDPLGAAVVLVVCVSPQSAGGRREPSPN